MSLDIAVCHPSVGLGNVENLCNSASLTCACQHWNLHHS